MVDVMVWGHVVPLTWSTAMIALAVVVLLRLCFRRHIHFDVERFLTPFDKLWLVLDANPSNLVVVNSITTTDGSITRNAMLEKIKYLVHIYKRFAGRPVVLGRWWWSRRIEWVACEVDFDYHLQEVFVPAPGTQKQVEEAVCAIVETPLDPNRPLWRHYLLQGINGTNSAFMFRAHHAVSDGVGLVGVLMNLTEHVKKVDVPLTKCQRRPSVYSALRPMQRLLLYPHKFTYRTVKNVILALYALGKLLLLPGDPHTCFKGKLTAKKEVAWSQTYDVPRVKAIGRRLGGTVNDVMAAAVTGALRRAILGRGFALKKSTSIHGVIPYNLRRIGEVPQSKDMCNKFSLLFLSLPVGIEDPLQRFKKVHQNSETLKNGMEPIVNYVMMKILGMCPSWALLYVFNLLSRSGSLVFSNVPAAQVPLTLCGRPVDHMFFFVPQTGDIGLGVSIFSLTGKIVVGVLVDVGLYDEPGTLVTYVDEELESLDQLSRPYRRKSSVRESAIKEAMAVAEAERGRSAVKEGGM